MNSILLEALVEQQQQRAKQSKYAQAFNALENKYRNAMEKAYGLENAEDWMTEGSLGRGADVATSRILGLFPGRVSEGRSEMTNVAPDLVYLLRSQGFKDAFQGAREAEMQLPNENDPRAVLNYFQAVRQMGSIPYAPNDPRLIRKNMGQTANESAFNKMLKEVYGEK